MLKVRTYPIYELFDLFESRFENLVSKTIDLSDNENDYSISLSVPGLTKKDIIINVDENHLEISHNNEKTENKNKFIRSFEKRYLLPDDSDVENILAKVENGILDITIPKMIKKKSKKVIEIQ